MPATGRETSVANRSARAVALTVFVLGLLIVVKPAVDHLDPVWSDNPFAHRTVTSTVTKKTSSGVETTTTIKPASDPFVERALGDSGILLLRVGVVALAAFLAGAVVQRTVLARFAIKIAGLEVPDLEEAAASSDAIAQVTRQLGKLKQRTKQQQKEIADLKSGAAKDVDNLAALATGLAELTRKVEGDP